MEENYLTEDTQENLSADAYVSNRITNMFLTLGMPTRIKGYRYLCEAVKIAVFDMKSLDRMTEDIYKKVALRFEEENEKNVCRACAYAVNIANDSGKMENLNKIIGVNVYQNKHERPSAGEFIAMIADRIRLDMIR